jgi:anti-sigma B factor antagonist
MSMSGDPSGSLDTPGSLRLRTESHHPAVVVHVSGEIDMLSAETLDTGLSTARTMVQPPGPFVVDLTSVGFLGSSGLAVLVDHENRCRTDSVELRLVAAHHAVLRPIQVTGLEQQLRLYATVPAALTTA